MLSGKVWNYFLTKLALQIGHSLLNLEAPMWRRLNILANTHVLLELMCHIQSAAAAQIFFKMPEKNRTLFETLA